MNANVCVSSQRLYRQLLLPYTPECQSLSDFSYIQDNKGQPGITGHLKGQVQGYRRSESEPLKKGPDPDPTLNIFVLHITRIFHLRMNGDVIIQEYKTPL